MARIKLASGVIFGEDLDRIPVYKEIDVGNMEIGPRVQVKDELGEKSIEDLENELI